MKRPSELMTRAGLMDRWNTQVGDRLEQGFKPRPLAAVKWSSRFRSNSSFIDIRNLRAEVLYDDPSSLGEPRIRVAGYWVQQTGEGVVFGGRDANRFDKQLALAPRCGARNARIDASDLPMLRSALLLDDRLTVAVKNTATRPTRVRIPSLWAGFDPAVADSVQGSGAELVGLCHSRGESSHELLERFRHVHGDLVLLPYEWCTGHWSQARAIFADFRGVARCQIIHCSAGLEELRGYRAASEFDFLSSRFRSKRRHSRSVSPPSLAAAQ